MGKLSFWSREPGREEGGPAGPVYEYFWDKPNSDRKKLETTVVPTRKCSSTGGLEGGSIELGCCCYCITLVMKPQYLGSMIAPITRWKRHRYLDCVLWKQYGILWLLRQKVFLLQVRILQKLQRGNHRHRRLALLLIRKLKHGGSNGLIRHGRNCDILRRLLTRYGLSAWFVRPSSLSYPILSYFAEFRLQKKCYRKSSSQRSVSKWRVFPCILWSVAQASCPIQQIHHTSLCYYIHWKYSYWLICLRVCLSLLLSCHWIPMLFRKTCAWRMRWPNC